MFALSQSLNLIFAVFGQHVNNVCCPGRTFMITGPIQGFVACVRFPSHWVLMNSSVYSHICPSHVCFLLENDSLFESPTDSQVFLSSKSKVTTGVSFCPEIVL